MNHTKEELEVRKYPMREDIINIILNRINEAFSDGFHKYEERRLMDALHSIKELIPPDRFAGTTYQKDRSYSKEDLRKFLEWERDNILTTVDKYYGWKRMDIDYPLLTAEQVVDEFIKETYPDKTVKP